MENAILEILRKGNDIHGFTSEIAEMMKLYFKWVVNNVRDKNMEEDWYWVKTDKGTLIMHTNRVFEFWHNEIYLKKEK